MKNKLLVDLYLCIAYTDCDVGSCFLVMLPQSYIAGQEKKLKEMIGCMSDVLHRFLIDFHEQYFLLKELSLLEEKFFLSILVI